MYLCTCVQVPWGLEACDPSGAGLTGVVSHVTWLLETDLGPLLEQGALLTPEPSISLAPPSVPSVLLSAHPWVCLFQLVYFSGLVSICFCFNLISFWRFPFLWWGFLLFVCSKGVYDCSLKHFPSALTAAPPTLFSLSLWLGVSGVPTGRLQLHVWNVLLRTKQHK